MTRGIQNPRYHYIKYRSTYISWSLMKTRCLVQSAHNYVNYGGRGIKVCPEWLASFENFLNDMGARPDGMSLDRIDVDGHYEPGNCRWATRKQQNNNRRDTRYLTLDGRTMCLSDWAKERGLMVNTITGRLASGKPMELVLQPGKLPRPRQHQSQED